jgi:hypothetical protein
MEIEEHRGNIKTEGPYIHYTLTLNQADLTELMAKEDILSPFSESEVRFKLDLRPYGDEPKAQILPNSSPHVYYIQSVGGDWDYGSEAELKRKISSWGQILIYDFEVPIDLVPLVRKMQEAGLQIGSASKPVIMGYVEIKCPF